MALNLKIALSSVDILVILILIHEHGRVIFIFFHSLLFCNFTAKIFYILDEIDFKIFHFLYVAFVNGTNLISSFLAVPLFVYTKAINFLC